MKIFQGGMLLVHLYQSELNKIVILANEASVIKIPNLSYFKKHLKFGILIRVLTMTFLAIQQQFSSKSVYQTCLIISCFLIIKLKEVMLQNQNSNQVMFSFLRHAQTYYNVRTDQVRTKYNDQNIQDNPQYKKVRYEKSFMDCSITQEGHAQCQKISKILEKQEFDLVIISPMRRALETCHHILANIRATKNIKFIVEPLITQRISSACNISSRISESIRDFEYINFDAVKDKTEDWYLQILPNETKNKIIQAKQCQQNKQICDLTLQLIKKYGSLEKNQNLMVRAKKARLRLFQLKKQFGAKKVLVIGHSIFFKYLLASGKNENGSIQNQPIMRNCQIIKKAITYQN